MSRYQPTAEQKAKADQRRAAFRALCQRVAAMSEDQRAAIAAKYGIVTCEGHPLSPHNSCLLASQCADYMPSIVGGFQQWRRASRQVCKGQSGLMLWIPSGKRKHAADDQHADSKAGRQGFIMGYVWDISQTEPILAE